MDKRLTKTYQSHYTVRTPLGHTRTLFMRPRGSVSIEIAGLTVIAVAAGIAMSVYVMRSLCGRWKLVGDTFGSGRQYDPRTTVSE